MGIDKEPSLMTLSRPVRNDGDSESRNPIPHPAHVPLPTQAGPPSSTMVEADPAPVYLAQERGKQIRLQHPSWEFLSFTAARSSKHKLDDSRALDVHGRHALAPRAPPVQPRAETDGRCQLCSVVLLDKTRESLSPSRSRNEKFPPQTRHNFYHTAKW